jgi:rhamnogalacturonan endolyase
MSKSTFSAGPARPGAGLESMGVATVATRGPAAAAPPVPPELAPLEPAVPTTPPVLMSPPVVTAPPTGEAPCPAPPTTGHYQMEDLDRGVVALQADDGIYVGWRMMGYEYSASDPSRVSYHLYRDGTLVANVTDSTNYLDASGAAGSTYSVSAVIDGTECSRSAAVSVWSQSYVDIPLTPPSTGPNGGTYSANDASVGDLDGDGRLDLVLKWDPSKAAATSSAGPST